MAKTQHVILNQLFPVPIENIDDESLLADLDTPLLRVNMISTLDGAASRNGLSGELGDQADRRYFSLLRRAADVILVGAGTVREEGYGSIMLSQLSRTWRIAHGYSPNPRLAIVSGELKLDPAAALFTDSAEPVILFTAAKQNSSAFADNAEVVIAGEGRVSLAQAVGVLRRRGMRRILCEGGPELLGDLLVERQVEEICLTLSASMDAGTAPRIATSTHAMPQDFRLRSILRAGSTLLLRYQNKHSAQN